MCAGINLEGDSKGQLLKWVGNKRRFADEIVSYFPEDYGTYFEPFLGSGAVWAALAPKVAHASDIFTPLIEIWRTLQTAPEMLKRWYIDRWNLMMGGNKVEVYENIKASYNARPNAADLLFLSRSCYGGVVRFRKRDGYMSTPCGPHKPMLKVPIPEGLFEREILVNCGGSMLKRFQMDGRTMEEEIVADRLLLTYSCSIAVFVTITEYAHVQQSSPRVA